MVRLGGRKVIKKTFYFHKSNIPKNFREWEKFCEGDLVRSGIVTYTKFFSEPEMVDIEETCNDCEAAFLKGRYLTNTG